MNYNYSARDYLLRAERLIKSGDDASLFYAAFELRCGIEARMRQYLQAWHVADKKLKVGWRMADLHRSLESAFRLGNRYARMSIHDAQTHELRVCFYYTPVTPNLKGLGEKLGNYLHVMKAEKTYDEKWWATFRSLLMECSESLSIATSGILIGPALLNSKNKVHMQIEIPGGTDKDAFLKACGGDGDVFSVHFSYPDKLPQELEPQAIMWED